MNRQLNCSISALSILGMLPVSTAEPHYKGGLLATHAQQKNSAEKSVDTKVLSALAARAGGKDFDRVNVYELFDNKTHDSLHNECQFSLDNRPLFCKRANKIEVRRLLRKVAYGNVGYSFVGGTACLYDLCLISGFNTYALVSNKYVSIVNVSRLRKLAVFSGKVSMPTYLMIYRDEAICFFSFTGFQSHLRSPSKYCDMFKDGQL